MKKISKKILFIILMSICFIKINNIKAVTIDKTSVDLGYGESENIDVYLKVDETTTETSFPLYYSSYDAVAYFVASEGNTANCEGTMCTVSLGKHGEGNIKIGTLVIKIKNNPVETKATVTIDKDVINVNIKEKNNELEDKKNETETTDESDNKVEEKEPEENNNEDNVDKKDEKDEKDEEDYIVDKEIEITSVPPLKYKGKVTFIMIFFVVILFLGFYLLKKEK